MTLATQFSLEEENFYKDIQDLVKKGSENEKELSTFLQRYMDLLARADLDDDTFLINFTKAALILEASAKVYGSKVDRLWINLERVLEALKVNGKTGNNKKKTDNEEDVEDVEGEVVDDAESQKKLPNPKRRKKLGDALSSPDDFLEIDNISGLLGKNMNETDNSSDNKIKFHEEIPNLFIRNKTDRKRVDLCLVQSTDDRDDSRLRDWIVSGENMLVKEIYIAQTECGSESVTLVSVLENYSEIAENNFDGSSICNDDHEVPEGEHLESENLASENIPDDSNNNVENAPDAALEEQPLQGIEKDKSSYVENSHKETLNRSQEIDLGKFPNIFLRRLEDCLVDVNEVFWNSTKFQDVIPSRKMRVKKTNKLPCKLCSKKEPHSKKGKRCHMFDKTECLDSYFYPLVQPNVSDPAFGILPDEELHNAYKIEMKLIEQLGKIDGSKNIYEAYHPDENREGECHNQNVTNFLGFDGFESRLMRRGTDFEDCELGDDVALAEAEDDNHDPGEAEEFELPLPVTENSERAASSFSEVYQDTSDPGLEQSRLEYQSIIRGELQSQEAAKSQFERNKELGMKIAQWHSSLVYKIEVSQKRGALNMDLLAKNIMTSFPEVSSGDNPVLSFQDLVRNKCTRDIPRYFFACLQLTNEGNITISKSTSEPLATDCMLIKRLRATRVRHELDEYTPVTNSPKRIDKSRSLSTCSTSPSKRKRHSSTVSSSDSESEKPRKKKTSQSKTEKSKSERRKRSLSSQGRAKARKKPREDMGS